MSTLISNEVPDLKKSLVEITYACNSYFASQNMQNAQTVSIRTKNLIEIFQHSNDPDTKEIITKLKAALEKDRTDNENGEADLVTEIRAITDIIQPGRIPLTRVS